MAEKKLSPLRLKDIETGRMEERAAIVAWCRNVNMDWCRCAEAIEAGEHLK